ncbi:MAG: hypothetical protein EON59_01720 [Alphaproteobacteria bacterium]|nr:MAG: hypothetical protein EON59_01720 [Alphaproteobacteria bacterium]
MLSWELAWPIGIALLGLAIAYGVWRYHSRNKANDAITEAATRELYKHPETYDQTREYLKQAVEPDKK